jgi:flagellar biogenesis protein FliO
MRNNAASHQSTQQSAQQSVQQYSAQQQPVQPIQSVPPAQTEYSGNNTFPPVQQVTAIEPAQSFGKTTDIAKPIRTTEPIRESESIRKSELAETEENITIDRITEIPVKNEIAGTINETDYETINEVKNSGRQNHKSTGNFSEQLLDKPIGSGKTENGKRLINRPKIANAITPLISVFGSLLIVIGVFFILVLFLKKVSPKGNRLLPKEAFEDLGRAMLTQKIQLHLLRLGNRLLLVSITPDGVSPITEITDPDEVVPLLGLCRQLDSNSSTEFFRKTLSSFSTGGTSGGYFGTDVSQTNLIGSNNRKNSSRNSKSKPTPLVDLYSEPDESLAEILAKGGQHG